jgi:deferrochelatase/peroxidase EfeB
MQEVQGNILRAYGNEYRMVRHLVLSVADPARARRALALMVDGDRATPDVTSGERAPKEAGYGWCLNVGFTYPGLKALGVPTPSLATFPPEFREGMVARASRLGDVGHSAPSNWVGGLADPETVHLIVTIHGRTGADVDEISGQVMAAARGQAFTAVSAEPFDGEALFDQPTGRRIVHFGYADGISQPRFVGIHDPADYPDQLPFSPIGVVLLGYPSAMPHVRWKVPVPDVLGRNGAFNAFRVLGQDVPAFEEFLTSVEAEHGGGAGGEGGGDDDHDGTGDGDRDGGRIERELVAAKLCGRWRNGVPLSLAPTRAEAEAFQDDSRLNDFDYADDDGDGERCPMGSHIRRTNPRGAHIVQRSANRTRSLVRRGVPYGPPWNAEDPGSRDVPRGLLGNFICGSLAAQFEAMSYDWVNLGFQDPRITGSNDPLIGANDPATSTFTWPRRDAEPLVLRGLPRFVSTRGGAYTFLPSIPAIRWISAQGA